MQLSLVLAAFACFVLLPMSTDGTLSQSDRSKKKSKEQKVFGLPYHMCHALLCPAAFSQKCD
jgi:hypothetical protein